MQNLFPDVFPLLIFHNQKPESEIPGEEFFRSGGEHLEPGVGVEVLEGGLEVGAGRSAPLAVYNQA